MNDVKLLTNRINHLTRLSRIAGYEKNWNLHNEYEEQIQRLKNWRKEIYRNQPCKSVVKALSKLQSSFGSLGKICNEVSKELKKI